MGVPVPPTPSQSLTVTGKSLSTQSDLPSRFPSFLNFASIPLAAAEMIMAVDNRTGKTITVPIVNNSIPATSFKALKAPFAAGERRENDTEGGVRVFDPGFMNTVRLEAGRQEQPSKISLSRFS